MAGFTPINALRYLQSGDPAEIHTATQNLATDIDSKLTARFVTTAARDAAITSPVAGMECWVGEVKYAYVGGGWKVIYPGRTNWGAMTLQRTADQSVPHRVWTNMTFTGIDYSEGSGLSSGGNGISVVEAGRYRVDGAVSIEATNGGRRILSISTSTVSGDSLRARSDGAATTGTGSSTTQIFQVTGEISVAAGQQIRLWVFQDSGTARNVDTRLLQVRRVG